VNASTHQTRRRPRVTASLWSVPRARVDAEAARIAGTGIHAWHWDHADGTLGPAGGFSADDARRIADATGVASEAHLLMEDPRTAVAQWAPFCELVVVHRESPHWREAVRLVVEHGAQAAVALSPGTPIVRDELGGLGALVMSVEPGHAGGAYDEGCPERVAALAGHGLVGVDGSLTPARAAELVAHGATWLVSGTSLVAAPEHWAPFLH